MGAQPQGRNRVRRAIVELLRTAIQVLVLFLVLSAVIGRFEIHQVSMEPNFHEGQRVIVSKLDGIWSSLFLRTAQAAQAHTQSPFAPQRGQVVVFNPPNGEGDALIKRVIGAPGDLIELRDEGVWVNGQLLDEPYVNGQATLCNNACAPIQLDANSYFLMGDNRSSSLDSRSFGPVRADRIIGRVVMRYWPLDQLEIYR
ncbi:MAG TPA: signal peptidase I [Roseiflexaceae bacterium]|nr:signal peptidase I [Roseiflexaceae bacterium]